MKPVLDLDGDCCGDGFVDACGVLLVMLLWA